MRISDWSSDVCSSDLLLLYSFVNKHYIKVVGRFLSARFLTVHRSLALDLRKNLLTELATSSHRAPRYADRKSVVSGKSVSVRVDLGGRRIIKKKKKDNENDTISVLQTTHNINE